MLKPGALVFEQRQVLDREITDASMLASTSCPPESSWADEYWRARRAAEMRAMERLHEAFPQDDELTTFYALLLLTAARAEDDSAYRREVAGALAMEVWRRNPNHPGAIHSIIHAFDDPIHGHWL